MLTRVSTSPVPPAARSAGHPTPPAVHGVAGDRVERGRVDDAKLARPLAVVPHVGETAAIGRDARDGLSAQQAVEPLGQRELRARTGRWLSAARPLGPERTSRGGARQRAPHAERNPLPRPALHQTRPPRTPP